MKLLSKFLLLSLFSSVVALAQKPKIYYVADPMCSWCYGFTPELEYLLQKYSSVLDFEIMVGGLNTESNRKLDQETRDSFKDHWKSINKETGMTFNESILNNKELVYNTELACRAVVTMKALKPEKHIEYFKLLQKSFYANNKNINNKTVLIELATEMGIDKDLFISKLDDAEIKKATKESFERVERNGIEGFPALVFVSEKETKIICSGYTKRQKIEKNLEKLLNK
ncbi:MAG: DsbA family protein [Cytophagales bacterium]